jgi:PBP1b-binding outer membrane lipoprotein LpoB
MKKIYINVCAIRILFSGCSNDLDVDQTESISTKDIALFNNDQGATTFVTAIYNKF